MKKNSSTFEHVIGSLNHWKLMYTKIRIKLLDINEKFPCSFYLLLQRDSKVFQVPLQLIQPLASKTSIPFHSHIHFELLNGKMLTVGGDCGSIIVCHLNTSNEVIKIPFGIHRYTDLLSSSRIYAVSFKLCLDYLNPILMLGTTDPIHLIFKSSKIEATSQYIIATKRDDEKKSSY